MAGNSIISAKGVKRRYVMGDEEEPLDKAKVVHQAKEGGRFERAAIVAMEDEWTALGGNVFAEISAIAAAHEDPRVAEADNVVLLRGRSR